MIFTGPVAPREKIMELLPTSERQVELEKQGILFAAGPMEPRRRQATHRHDHYQGRLFDDAHAIAMEDPLHASGLREFDIWNWSMNEGSFTVTISY